MSSKETLDPMSCWLKTDDGFGILGLNDSVKGRRLYVQRLEDQLVKESTLQSCPNIKVYREPSTAGCIGGSEQFREYLLKKVDAAAIRRNRNYQSAQMGRDHGQAEAEKIVQQGLERFELSESDLESMSGSDQRKVAIANSIHQSTTTPLSWTAERLRMKSAANVSQQLSRAKKAAKPKFKLAEPTI